MKPFGGFDHNINSLKIMTEIESHYPHFKGLNLTWETLEGTVKHNGPLQKISSAWLKNFNQQFPLDLKKCPSLEAQIAACADDIAYNNHDIDDGFRAGFFTINQLRELDFIDEIITKFDRENKNCRDELRIYAITRSLISDMVFDILSSAQNAIKERKIKNIDDVHNQKSFTITFSSGMSEKISRLHNFLKQNFYTHSNIARMDMKSQKIVEDLFNIFLDNEKALPFELRPQIENISDKKEKADIICTYIANMTDAYAVEEHQKLFNISYRF